MTADELAAELYGLAEARAQAAGRNFGEGADHDLHQITETGAQVLLAISDERQREVEIEQAKVDIVRLIDMAIAGAQGIAGYRANLLGEQSYFPAKLRFCPCRPFC